MDSYRVPGEFEAQESVLMMWPTTSYATGTKEFDRDAVAVDIVRHLLGNVRIVVTCYDERLKLHAVEKLQEAGVDLSQVEFMLYPSRITYPRDFGAEVMVDAQGNRLYVDLAFDFYGMGLQGAPLARTLESFDRIHAEYLGIKDVRFSRLVSEGGDREFNGQGLMMTIEETEVNKRNPGWSKEEVEAEFKRLFNLEKVVWIPRATFDDELMYMGPIPDEHNEYKAYRSSSANGHIDEMCRFIREDTVLLAYISEEEARESELHRLNKERLDEALEVLSAATTSEGKPLNIVKIPVPEPIYIDLSPGDYHYELIMNAAKEYGGKMMDGSPFPTGPFKVLPALSYCNFLVSNGIVLAQKYYREGMSEAIREKDEEALETLKKCFPGRRVVAIDSIALNLFGGGVHCNTRNVPR